MTGSEIDRTLERVRRKKSYFDDPEDLGGCCRRKMGQDQKDGTMAKVLGADPKILRD
jgi:hypothetical protein